MVHMGPFPRTRLQLVLRRHIFSDYVKKVKREIDFFQITFKVINITCSKQNSDSKLDCSSLLDIYLKHWFKIVF